MPSPQGTDPAIADRLAQYMGAIHVAAKTAHCAVGFDWNFDDALRHVWGELMLTAADAPGDERALRDVLSWSYAHEQSFYGRAPDDVIHENFTQRMPPTGWSGRWDSEDWTFLGFYPTVLKKVLTEQGYNFEAVVAAWKERGWLSHGNDRKRNTRQERVGIERPHLIVIKREAIEAVDGGDGGDGGDVVETQVERAGSACKEEV